MVKIEPLLILNKDENIKDIRRIHKDFFPYKESIHSIDVHYGYEFIYRYSHLVSEGHCFHNAISIAREVKLNPNYNDVNIVFCYFTIPEDPEGFISPHCIIEVDGKYYDSSPNDISLSEYYFYKKLSLEEYYGIIENNLNMNADEYLNSKGGYPISLDENGNLIIVRP